MPGPAAIGLFPNDRSGHIGHMP
ncbi:protein of unknown function [Azospirillum baldaniorum]|uniref:Uncharacterized protein n=1 Tax=Azospirillum baldaniorum TaxID=1064539 RepID=A0A9P1JMZ1_9PROT|nr:protein of unknown function [Azospirillum baldaniorum]